MSWKRLTHMSCTGVRTEFPSGFETAETTAMKATVMVIDIWNYVPGY